jgi:type III pantothenate kinase
MILAVDIGNTNAVIGAFEGEKQLFLSRIATDLTKMCDDYAVTLKSIVSLYGFSVNEIEGAIVSSVVPPVCASVVAAINRICPEIKVMQVGPGIKTGLNIKIDNPAQTGADLVCVSVAAINKYPLPSIVIDMGTATSITALDEQGNFLGGSIIPGVRISLEALSSRTAQLPQISLNGEAQVIGKNTVDAMRSGVVVGNAAMIDGMILRYREILGDNLTVILTGGMGKNIAKHCREQVIYDENLLLDGLRILYHKNK